MFKKIFIGLVSVLFMFITSLSVYAAEVHKEYPHWKKSVIDVYIPNDPSAALMRNAFLSWSGKTNGKTKFKFVSKGPADIDVVFTENASGDTPITSYNTQIKGKEITKAEIKIATKSPKIKNYSKNYIYTTMLHEVGHSLGLSDNDRKPESIMYRTISSKQEILKYDLRELYKINGWSFSHERIGN